MERIFGIDLGTTMSVVAQVSAAGLPVVLPNAEGSPTTPSRRPMRSSGTGRRLPATAARGASDRRRALDPAEVASNLPEHNLCPLRHFTSEFLARQHPLRCLAEFETEWLAAPEPSRLPFVTTWFDEHRSLLPIDVVDQPAMSRQQ